MDLILTSLLYFKLLASLQPHLLLLLSSYYLRRPIRKLESSLLVVMGTSKTMKFQEPQITVTPLHSFASQLTPLILWSMRALYFVHYARKQTLHVPLVRVQDHKFWYPTIISVSLSCSRKPQDSWHRGHSNGLHSRTRICLFCSGLANWLCCLIMNVNFWDDTYKLCSTLHCVVVLGCAALTESYWASAINLTKYLLKVFKLVFKESSGSGLS